MYRNSREDSPSIERKIRQIVDEDSLSSREELLPLDIMKKIAITQIGY
jgi:hypothetical protein